MESGSSPDDRFQTALDGSVQAFSTADGGKHSATIARGSAWGAILILNFRMTERLRKSSQPFQGRLETAPSLFSLRCFEFCLPACFDDMPEFLLEKILGSCSCKWSWAISSQSVSS
jgi:hypothetical protein